MASNQREEDRKELLDKLELLRSLVDSAIASRGERVDTGWMRDAIESISFYSAAMEWDLEGTDLDKV